MRILHIVSNISVRSGIMSMLMSYYRKLDREKIQFDFLYFDERTETYEAEIISLGGQITKVEHPSHLFLFRKDINLFFRQHYGAYPIIHIHDIFMSGFVAQCKRIGGVKKIIVHAHATKFADNKLNAIRNKILSIPNYIVPDYYFACSKMAGEYCFGKRFNEAGIVINNAIDLNEFYPDKKDREHIRRHLGIEDKFVIGHVGNFTPQKNHEFIIRIFKQIVLKNKDAVLVLVGDGNLRKKIEEEVIKNNLKNNVIFLGTRNDVNFVMRAFDCFLFPSLFEGLGIVLIEAQATGVPCVLSDVIPSDTNIIKERNIVLSLKDSEKIWAEKVLSMVEQDYRDFYKQVSEAGYNIEIEAKKLLEVYYSLWNTVTKNQ